VLNRFTGLTFRWIVFVFICAFSLIGCLNLPTLQPVETQTLDLKPTPVYLTDTDIPATPSLGPSQTQSPETETPSLQPNPTQLTETQAGETQSPTLNPTRTQPAETATLSETPTLTSLTETQPSESNIRIPTQSDWVDYGTILEAGVVGEWDLYLWGGFAFSVIKRDSTYYLYYQGSSDYRTEIDETVLWRTIGVATSQDGIHFKKYENNPILTWFPNQNGEEGAVSSGVTLGEQGETILFYGANTQEGPTSVNADVRVASSLDGFRFTDLSVALDHTDKSVWGSGDELFSVDAIYDSGKWIVYYIPNGTVESGLLGVAYGDQYNALTQSSAVTSSGQPLSVWGAVGHVKLTQGTYALILNNVREHRTEVRQVSLQTPNTLSEPIAVYQFDEVQQAVLLLDKENETWFMYYRTFANSYGVKLAPAGDEPLRTPSTP
jgi:hypothetical protein